MIRSTSLLISVLILFVACTSPPRETGQAFPVTAISEFERGKTTQADVRSALGEPQEKKISSGTREIWTYKHLTSRVTGYDMQILFGLPGTITSETTGTVAEFVFSGELLTDYTVETK